MSLVETYFLLFTDTLVNNLAFNVSSEVMIEVMSVFGNYEISIIILVATLAFTIAGIINYIFGKAVYKILIPTSQNSELSAKRLQKIQNSRYLPLFLMLSAIPFFGKFILLLAGFCQIRFVLAITIASFARFGYYLYLILI
jgi:membrane protein YqaA with SNARE-associated domain